VVRVSITAPYEKGTSEYQNFLDNVGEFVKTGFDPEIKLHICEQCEDCGAINDTVADVQGGNRKAKLCDRCADA